MRDQLQGQEREVPVAEGDRAAQTLTWQYISGARSKNAERRLPVALRHFWIAIATLPVLAIILCHYLHMRLLSHNEFPFADLFTFQSSFRMFGTSGFYQEVPGEHARWTYPDTMAIFYRFLYSLAHPLVGYLVIVAGMVGWGAIAFVKQLTKRGIAVGTAIALAVTAVATSYPLWILIDTGNLELFVVFVVAAGVACFLTGKTWWAGALFGLAAAMKLFPVIFLSLLFSRRYWRQFLFGAAVGAAYFIGCHWFVGPTLWEALRGTSGGLDNYAMHSIYGIRAIELGSDISLFGLVKHFYLVKQTLVGPLAIKIPQVYHDYVLVAGALCTLLFFLRIRKVPALNQVFAITVLTLMLPPASYDYRLCHLYVPWAFLVFLVLDRKREPEQPLQLLLIFSALIFTPQSFLFYWMGRDGVAFAVTYGGQFKTLLMLGILGIALWYPLTDPATEMAEV